MSTDAAKAGTTVVTCLALSGVVAFAGEAATGNKPTARQVIGLTFTAVTLTAMAQLVPELGAALALLVLTSSVFVYGGPAFAAISKATTTPTTKGK